MGDATILYATGTGNSWHAAEAIHRRLAAAGWSVTMRELRVGMEPLRGGFRGDLLVLSFPTLGFAMPAGLRGLLRGLRAPRRGPRVPAAVFATWGGDPGAALFQARGFLRRRGFRVIAASGAAYPINWTQFLDAPQEPGAREMTREGDAAAGRFADGLPAALPGARLPVSAALWMPVARLFMAVGAPALGAIYAADGRCTACGICARDCPAAAIRMAGKGKGRRPRWNLRCWGCNRCINLCPEAAIQTSPLRTVVQLTVNCALIAASAVVCNRLAGWAALPPAVTVPGWIVLFTLLVAVLSRLQFLALEPLLFLLESAPGLRRLAGRSWTAGFRRYRCEGFRPGARTVEPAATAPRPGFSGATDPR